MPASSLVRMSRNPMMMPTTMRRHDSGKMLGNLGVMWKPEKRGVHDIRLDLQSKKNLNLMHFG